MLRGKIDRARTRDEKLGLLPFSSWGWKKSRNRKFEFRDGEISSFLGLTWELKKRGSKNLANLLDSTRLILYRLRQERENCVKSIIDFTRLQVVLVWSTRVSLAHRELFFEKKKKSTNDRFFDLELDLLVDLSNFIELVDYPIFVTSLCVTFHFFWQNFLEERETKTERSTRQLYLTGIFYDFFFFCWRCPISFSWCYNRTQQSAHAHPRTEHNAAAKVWYR